MRRGSADSIRASGQKAPHRRPDTKLQSACPSYSNRSLRSGRRPYKGHVGQHVGLRVVHDGGELGDLRADLVGDRAPLYARGFRRLLGEGGGNEGRDDPRRQAGKIDGRRRRRRGYCYGNAPDVGFRDTASYRFWRCGAFPPSPARPCRRDKILPWSGPLSRIAVFGRPSRHQNRTKSMT